MANSSFTPTFSVSDGSVGETQLAAGATLKLGTPQASTSGTAITFTGIPSGTKQIIISGDGVSTNGTSFLGVRLGISSGLDSTSDYKTRVAYGATTVAPAISQTDAGLFILCTMGHADNLCQFSLTLTLMNASTNAWSIMLSAVTSGTTAQYTFGTGTKALSGVLDRVSITSSDPDTFDAGSINIAYK